MKRTLAIGILMVLLCARATASPLNLNIHINLNGHEHDVDINLGDFHIGHGRLFGGGLLGDVFGGHLGGGLFGGGYLGLNNFEAQQTRFETRFAEIQSTYDDGVANIEDFYTSDEYDDVVSDAKLLSRRYDRFVTRVEHTIDGLGTAVDASNDSIEFVQNLLDDYKSRDLSEKRLAHIDDVLTTIQDNIQLKIDFLTEKKTNLSDNLPTYQGFQTQVSAFVDTIVAAGGGTTDGTGDSSSAALRALTAVGASATTAGQAACGPGTVSPTSAVPEPSAVLQTLIAASAIGLLRQSPPRR